MHLFFVSFTMMMKSSTIAAAVICILVSGFSYSSADCIADTGDRCMTKSDEGAALYFDYFQWTGGDPCFLYNDARRCMIRLGVLTSCTCTPECGCAGVIPTPPLNCDSSSVEQVDCSAAKTIYCALGSDNTRCESCGVDNKACYSSVCQYGITESEDIKTIVDKHNELRAKVANGQETKGVGGGQPSAADMNKLEWDEDLAAMAQAWASQCPNGHDHNRLVPEFSGSGKWVGQNMADTWTSVKSATRNYENMIQAWYNEVDNWPAANVGSFSSDGATGTIGHYTALIWAKTKKVGCGFIQYKDEKQPSYPYRQTLVCNYGNGGNMQKAPVYTIGIPGSLCKNGSENGLCL